MMRKYLYSLGISLSLVLLLGTIVVTSDLVVANTLSLETTTPFAIPNEPQRGLVFDGLERDSAGPCHPFFRLRKSQLCTHGPDALPADTNIQASVLPVPASAMRPSSFLCDGDGKSGKRVQAIYVHASDRPNRYNTYAASFQQWLAELDDNFHKSSAETGGIRQVRFVHDANCNPIVHNVTVSPTGDDDFDNTVTELQAKGYNQSNRKYLLYVDSNVYCGIASWHKDDRPDPANPNNSGPSYARTDFSCWGGVESHELGHTLGAVQLSAPHSSNEAHCFDSYDTMCDGGHGGIPNQIICPNLEHHFGFFDCNHDDYFHTNPPAGSYLSTHWNVANSQFLISRTAACQPTLTITNILVENGIITLKWNVSGPNCSRVVHTNLHWDSVSHAGQRPVQYPKPDYYQVLQGPPGDFEEYFFSPSQGSVFLIVHALVDSHEVVSSEQRIDIICPRLTLDVNPPGAATFTVSPEPNCGDDRYLNGEEVIVKANANSGYYFWNWTENGNYYGNMNPSYLYLTEDLTLRADFRTYPQCFNFFVRAKPTDTGAIQLDPQPNCLDGTGYMSNTIVTLKAKPISGYHFIRWNGAPEGNANPLTIEIIGRRFMEAVFSNTTPTPTPTVTPTPTATPTLACTGAPPKPLPIKPKNGKTVKKPEVKLDWSDASCAYAYSVIVREGSEKGPKFQAQKNLTVSQLKTKTLTSGKTYFWKVKAFNNQGKSASAWWSFTVE